MGKVLKKVTKPIQKLIPKEIKPFLPALAAVFGPAAFASMGGGIGAAFAKLPAFAQAAIVNATTQGVVEGKIDPKQVAASGITAQLGSSLKGFGNAGSNIPLESADPKTFLQKAATVTGEYLQPSSVSSLFDPNTTLSAKDVGSALYSGAKASLPVSTYAGAEKLKEINEDELRKYNEQLRERGVTDKIGRRKGIYDIYASIEDEGDDGKYRVYSDEYINSILDKYGYKKGGKVSKPEDEFVPIPSDDFAKLIEEFIRNQDKQEQIRRQNKANGGRIGFETGGEVAALAAEVKRLQSENAELKSKSGLRETREGIDYATKGFEQAFGSPLMGQVPSPQRIIPGFARGGIASLETVAMQPNENENTQMASHSGNDDLAEQLFEEFLDMGMTPQQAAAAVRDYFNSSKMGMAEGGKVMVASHSGNDSLSEQLFEEFLGMGMTPDQAAAAVRDYFNSSRMGMEDGGKVIPMLPEGVFYKGKAKDYPGASKAIKDALKKDREKKAEGGLLGLKKGGVPAEFDYRGGGIIEVGSKPKADDVPARLSKGEFVLTKKAVDGIGNGSNREGAKVLYQLMDKLEAMA